MKRNTQMRFKKLIMLGVLSGVVWGSAFAAEPTIPSTATPTIQNEASVSVNQSNQVANGTNMVNDNGEHSFTYYDQLQRNKQMARSQSQANAAIFLSTVAPDVKSPNKSQRRHQEYSREANRGSHEAPNHEQSERIDTNQFQGKQQQNESFNGANFRDDVQQNREFSKQDHEKSTNNWQKQGHNQQMAKPEQHGSMSKHHGQPPMSPNGNMPPMGQGFDGQPPMGPNGNMPPMGQGFHGQPPMRPNGNMPPMNRDFNGHQSMKPNGQMHDSMMPPEPPSHMQGSKDQNNMPPGEKHTSPKDSKTPMMNDYNF